MLTRGGITDQTGDAATFFEASQVLIIVNTGPLEPAAAFPYLGRKFASNNRNWAALYQNLRKAQRRCGMIRKVVTKTGATVRSWGMTYK